MLILSSPYFLNEVTAALKTLLTGPPSVSVHLFQNDFIPTENSTTGDFVEATFDGYAAQVEGVWFGPERQTDGSFQVFCLNHWKMIGTTSPQAIFGAYFTDTTSNALLFAERFDQPVNMVDQYSGISVESRIGVASNGLSGGLEPVPD